MASVPLVFNLPAEEGLTALKIFEAPVAEGPWTLIETVTEIGVYPDYIHEYETSNATSAVDWFAISVVDQAGVESDLSVPMLGGTQTLVHDISSRVMQRGISLSESVVIQEAEAVIEMYFNTDPYLVNPLQVKYNTKAGLTYLVMGRAALFELASSGGTTSGWTAGLVSMKSGDASASKVSLDWLMREAQNLLGIAQSRIAQMIVPEIAGGLSFVTNYDVSRLQVTTIE